MKNTRSFCEIKAKLNKCIKTGAGFRQQAGFSLIELMVAITLGLLITAALITLFLNINRTNTEMAKSNSQIENGRFALQLLQTDIAHAGFWGGYVPQFDDLTLTSVPVDTPTAVPNPCLSYSATNWTTAHVRNLIGISVQSYVDTLPTGCSSVITSKRAATDVLVVRHAETCVAGSGGNCENDMPGKVYLQSSQCELEIAATPYILADTGFTMHKRDCVGTGTPQALPITSGSSAEKRKFISNIYYISTINGVPTLMLSQFDGTSQQAPVSLIENIEGFQIEFGIDSISDANATVDYTAAVNWANPAKLTSPTNRGDGVPDGAFIRCTDAVPCTAAQLTNVVAVKLYVLARADSVSPGYTDTKTYALGSTTLGPYNDGFKRHVFSTTVRLNNVSGRRETPP